MNHVLVVDDEANIRESLEEILREEGYGVASAPTAAEAKVLIEDAPYDVVLLDIWLPDRDGLDVLHEIHQFPAETRPEVVIISGHGITDEIRERLFLPFYSTKHRGTGLGLSIAAKIVQEHGGSIRAESNAPKGARFLMRIPLMEYAPDAEQREHIKEMHS